MNGAWVPRDVAEALELELNAARLDTVGGYEDALSVSITTPALIARCREDMAHLMKRFTTTIPLVVLLFFAVSASAVDEVKLLRAIDRAEGGHHAKRPYGVLAIRVRDRAHAREVCLRTIRSAARDWDGRGDFVAFLGRRYCPPSVDPVGHKNWVTNVRKLSR